MKTFPRAKTGDSAAHSVSRAAEPPTQPSRTVSLGKCPLKRALRKKLVKLLKRRGRPAINRLLSHYSKVGDPVVFEPELFPWAARLEANWRVIRAEAELTGRAKIRWR